MWFLTPACLIGSYRHLLGWMCSGLHPLLQKSTLKWLWSYNETDLTKASARLVTVHLLKGNGREAAEIMAREPEGFWGALLTFPRRVQNRFSFWMFFSWLCKSVQSLRPSHFKLTLFSQGCWKDSNMLLIGMQAWKNCKEYLQLLSLNQNHQLNSIACLTSFLVFL